MVVPESVTLITIAKETLWPIIQPIAQPILVSLAKSEAGQLASASVDKAKRVVDDPLQRLSLKLSNAVGEYGKIYIKRHGILKVLGMREPVNLDEVYTNVRLLNEYSIRDFASTEALETAFRESSQRRLQGGKCETRVGVEVAREQQFLMVLGQPGAGKSTFLRKMGLEALKGKKGDYQQDCIPVFLELKRFDDIKVSILDRITAEFETCGFPKPEQFTTRLLEKGKLLVLFDGLDEVPSQAVNGVIDQIQDFVDRYDQNRFIASCRTAAYRSGFRRFTDVVMADFDDAQIQQYIENWFSSDRDRQEKTAEYCWKLLNQNDQQGAKELAQTPLLLTFLCLVYDRSQSFSSNRSALYRKALRILLEEWAAEKRINREDVHKGLHLELEEVLLSEIAYNNFIKDQLFFEKSDLLEQIREFLTGNSNVSKDLNSEAILEAIAVQQGILVERAENVYSFSHLTLQEYLTAQHILELDRETNLIESLVDKYLLKKEWSNIFLLLASSMKGLGADRFLKQIIFGIERFQEQTICREKLEAILLWVDSETKDLKGSLSNVGRRSIAHASIININHVHSITTSEAIESFIDYYQRIEQNGPVFSTLNATALIRDLRRIKTQFLYETSDQSTQEILEMKLIDTVLDAHSFPRSLTQISHQERDIIDTYHYATYILIQCKEAAIRVSPDTWADIKERMWRVPERLRENNS